jgi:Protein of unknown function (DUF4236)/HicB family
VRWDSASTARISLPPGVRFNASKSGASVSIGHRGAWMTVGPRGRRVTTPELHQMLALEAAEAGVSLNRLESLRLAMSAAVLLVSGEAQTGGR